MPETVLLTLKEAAEELRVSTRTLRRLIESGDLEAIAVRRGIRIRRDDLRSYVDGLAQTSHNAKRAGPDVRKGESTCRSANHTGTAYTSGPIRRIGGPATPMQAAEELAAVLGLKIERRRKHC